MSQSAVQKFIAVARELFADEKDPAKRWEKMTPLLQELLADRIGKEAIEELARLLAKAANERKTYFSMKIPITSSLSTV